MASRAGRDRAKTQAARRSAIDRKYAERHPARARDERALRKAQASIDKAKRRRGDAPVEATPETLAKAHVRDGAMARLCLSGAIDADQLAWSQEIRAAALRIGADVAIGTVSLETRVDTSRAFDGTFFEKLGAVRAEVAYTRWRRSLASPAPVLAMIVEDLGCNDAGRRFRKDKRTLRRLLVEALDAWPGFCADARRDVDEATLLAAQAAIL